MIKLEEGEDEAEEDEAEEEGKGGNHRREEPKTKRPSVQASKLNHPPRQSTQTCSQTQIPVPPDLSCLPYTPRVPSMPHPSTTCLLPADSPQRSVHRVTYPTLRRPSVTVTVTRRRRHPKTWLAVGTRAWAAQRRGGASGVPACRR